MQNFYEKIYDLEKNLTRAGFQYLGEQLRDAVLQGSTGTEIFMALKYNLKAIKKYNLNKNLMNEVKLLIKYIDKEL